MSSLGSFLHRSVASIKSFLVSGVRLSRQAQFGCASGVIRTRVGFTGGSTEFPTYHNIADHTETVDIEYDPKVTSYERLLGIFWSSHDSTSCHSRQYMSAIFYHNDEQKKLAEQTKGVQQKKKMRQITTKILSAQTFYNAENYHQKYLLRNNRALLSSLGLDDAHLISSYVACRLNGYVGGYGSEDQFDKDLPTLGLSDQQEEYVRMAIEKRYPATN